MVLICFQMQSDSRYKSFISFFVNFHGVFSGAISPMDWCSAMEAIMDVDVPWVLLRSRLVTTTPAGEVLYMTTFENNKHASAGTKRILANDFEVSQNVMLFVVSQLYYLATYRSVWCIYTFDYSLDLQVTRTIMV